MDGAAYEDGDQQADAPAANVQVIRPMFGMGLSAATEVRLKDDEDPYGYGLYLELDRVWRAKRVL